jgi:hypothetical protein
MNIIFHFLFQSGLSDIRFNCNRFIEGLLYIGIYSLYIFSYTSYECVDLIFNCTEEKQNILTPALMFHLATSVDNIQVLSVHANNDRCQYSY